MIRGKPHALASTPATPKKNVSCFFDLAGVKFFLEMGRTFFFLGLPSEASGGGAESVRFSFASPRAPRVAHLF